MNIVYGGTFNPPTLAHENIVKKLQKMFNPKNIIIVPTASNYTWKTIDSFKERYNMCKIAFKGAIISDIEASNKEYRGTLDTLNRLSEKYEAIYFCMGADNLVHIKKWINYETLLKKYHFIIFKRDNIDIDDFIKKELLDYKDKFIVVDFENTISSSSFRKTHDYSLLSNDVKEYIIKNNLEDLYV